MLTWEVSCLKFFSFGHIPSWKLPFGEKSLVTSTFCWGSVFLILGTFICYHLLGFGSLQTVCEFDIKNRIHAVIISVDFLRFGSLASGRWNSSKNIFPNFGDFHWYISYVGSKKIHLKLKHIQVHVNAIYPTRTSLTSGYTWIRVMTTCFFSAWLYEPSWALGRKQHQTYLGKLLQTSWATKKPLLPWNPGCLIGIIMS